MIFRYGPFDGKHCTTEEDVINNSFEVVFFSDDVAVARRTFTGRSIVYIDSAVNNWLVGVLKTEHFSMEERLRA